MNNNVTKFVTFPACLENRYDILSFDCHLQQQPYHPISLFPCIHLKLLHSLCFHHFLSRVTCRFNSLNLRGQKKTEKSVVPSPTTSSKPMFPKDQNVAVDIPSVPYSENNSHDKHLPIADMHSNDSQANHNRGKTPYLQCSNSFYVVTRVVTFFKLVDEKRYGCAKFPSVELYPENSSHPSSESAHVRKSPSYYCYFLPAPESTPILIFPVAVGPGEASYPRQQSELGWFSAKPQQPANRHQECTEKN